MMVVYTCPVGEGLGSACDKTFSRVLGIVEVRKLATGRVSATFTMLTDRSDKEVLTDCFHCAFQPHSVSGNRWRTYGDVLYCRRRGRHSILATRYCLT